jgi:ankyrin repeat protein
MEVRDRYGNTALLLAMKEGHFGIVRLLTEMVS